MQPSKKLPGPSYNWTWKQCSIHIPPGVGCTLRPCTVSSSFASSPHCLLSRVGFRDWGSHSSTAQNPAKRQIRLQKPSYESAAEAVEAVEAAPSGLTNRQTGDESLQAPPSSLSLSLPFYPPSVEQDVFFALRTRPKNFPLNVSLICQASTEGSSGSGGGKPAGYRHRTSGWGTEYTTACMMGSTLFCGAGA